MAAELKPPSSIQQQQHYKISILSDANQHLTLQLDAFFDCEPQVVWAILTNAGERLSVLQTGEKGHLIVASGLGPSEAL